MSNHLVISALGEDQPDIVNKLSQMIVERKGNISSSRMMAMGGEFALMLMVDGNETTINDIQTELAEMESTLNLTIISRHTQLNRTPSARISYSIEVVAMDHPGIVQQIADFFSTRQANIEEMNTDTYSAAHTGTQMFALHMLVGLPADTKIAPLREQFIEFCDDRNLDGSMEIS